MARLPDALGAAVLRAALDTGALAAVRRWLAEQLAADQYAKLSQGGHINNQVPLRQVFVDLPVTNNRTAEAHGDRVPFLAKLMQARPIALRTACASLSGIGLTDSPDSSPQLDADSPVLRDSVIRSLGYSATLLIGGPGQGKSTLGQIACQLHRAALLKASLSELSSAQQDVVRSFEPRPDKGRPSATLGLRLPRSPLVPLHVALPDFAAWLSRENAANTDALPALVRFVAHLPSASSSKLTAEILFRLICSHPTLMVLDGFDEVGSPEDRRHLVAATRELLRALADKNAHGQVLATTRPQGYAGELADIGLPLRERYLVPLTRDEALVYAEKLVRAKIDGLDVQERTLTRLREAAREEATVRLLSTPLQVTILAALIQQLGRAPRERWTLFAKYFEVTYDREIERGTYASRLLAVHKAHIQQIHARVGLLLQVEAERAGGAAARMPRSRLEEVIDSVLREDEFDDEARRDLARDIALAAELRLVFLVEPEPGLFGFEIRSLQEFMAAWALTTGRDSEVEARLLQVAKASMFRNVTLFIASRLFSEGSPLRDSLADRVCGAIDEDPTDDAARLSRSGALLALETLEEGAVLTQPKRARALMERATRLLDLPPSAEHLRLARVATSDTAPLLRTAIEGRLRDASQPDRVAAWLCLIEATSRARPWAVELANASQMDSFDVAGLLLALARTRAQVGPWLARWIEAHASLVSPGLFAIRPLGRPIQGEQFTWTTWLARVYSLVARRGQHRTFLYVRRVVPDESADAGDLRAQVASAPPSPPQWRPWIAAAEFELSPSSPKLALALRAIAKGLSQQEWRSLSTASSWPMAACLETADSAVDLERFADMAEQDVLGNREDWIAAEQSWTPNRELTASVRVQPEDAPWSRESLRTAPPLLLMPLWTFEVGSRNTAARIELMEACDAALSRVRATALQRRLADVCLAQFQRLPRQVSRQRKWPVLRWVRTATSALRYLIPKPRGLQTADWKELLKLASAPTEWFFYNPHLWVSSLVHTSPNTELLKAAAHSIGHGPPHNVFEIWPEGERRAALNALHLRRKEGRDRGYAAVLRMYLGDATHDEVEDLVSDIASTAQAESGLWAAALAASKSLDTKGRSRALSAMYSHLRAVPEWCSLVVEGLRELTQRTRSDLETQSTWNRLGLPLPHPPVARPVALDGRIPPTPIGIEAVSLRDVRGIRHLSIPPAPPRAGAGQWVVILGPNGSGKTTLLRSLAVALRNTKDPTIWPRGSFGDLWPRITGSTRAPEARISVRLSDGTSHETVIRLDEHGAAHIAQFPEQQKPRLVPLFAYGCRRGSALGGAAREVDLRGDDGREIATLFDEGADLIHAETWLLQMDGDASRSQRSATLFRSVTSALRQLLDLGDIFIDGRRVWVVDQNGSKVPFAALSDGYLTSAGWFLDLVARWVDLLQVHSVDLQPDFLQQMRALVLVDEIDLHLHPRWQVDVITRTRRLLPQVSFVVTTHNPLTLVGSRPDEIWVLSIDRETGVVATPGDEAPMLLTGGELYKKYFGIDDIFPDAIGRTLQRFAFLSGYAARTDDEQRELEALRAELMVAGVEPSWEIVPRSALIPRTRAEGGEHGGDSTE